MSTRFPSPCAGRRPTRRELPAFRGKTVDDRLPTADTPYPVRMLIVGVNPGLWTAAVNAPFAYPGNRFWPSLDRAGIITPAIDCTAGMSDTDEQRLVDLGIGITNLVNRATARADELLPAELIQGWHEVVRLTGILKPNVVTVAGITAYRVATQQRKAQLGTQETSIFPGWPVDTALVVVPQPSGLNAHATIDSLAAQWQAAWEYCRD
ncbi:mismatch-specific DNA-glycosylase [Corynebacterium choanae]|nr:mismatch-specific DNA-glycosylase [Corynebacterium choanae]